MTINGLRELTGLSQARFAETYHLNKKTLQNWEQGVRECPEAVLELIKDKMGFYDKDTEGVHDLEFWMHYDEYNTKFSILRNEGFHRDKCERMIRNDKVWFSDMGSFVEGQLNQCVEDMTDNTIFDPEVDDIKDFKLNYTCGYNSFISLANAIRRGEYIDRDFTYVGMFNPNEDLGLENDELNFDIPYIVEVTE